MIGKNNEALEEALSKLSRPDIEEYVIGSLVQGDTEDTSRAIEALRAEAFSNKDYRTLFAVVKRMKRESTPVDIVSVFTELQKSFSNDEAARLNLISLECSKSVASTANLPQHANELRELYTRREAIINRYRAIQGFGDLSIPLEETLSKEIVSKDLLQTDREAKYSYLLRGNTEKDLLERMQTKQGEIPTLYEFKHPVSGEKERFNLPSGAITFVVAPTSHGKSTLLQNIALQVARLNDPDGVTLYFTFEEDGDSVTLQILNKFMNIEFKNERDHYTYNNQRAITHYYRTGTHRQGQSNSQITTIAQKKAEFFSTLYNSGKLKIFYEDYDSTELIEAIRYINSQTKVKAVFIDYIQLLSKSGCRLQRTEELKEICKDLKNLCVETQLPIVVAAQANREVTSPLEMHSQKIAEAADLERIANKILFIWNSSFVAQKSKDSTKELESFETRTGIHLGTSGKIYAKLTKNRGGIVGIEAVLDFHGNTGVIAPNCEATTPEQSTINFDEATDDSNILPF